MNIKKLLCFTLLISFAPLQAGAAAESFWPPSLANCGATCFINANIQLLYNIPRLTELLVADQNPFNVQTAPTPYNYTELIRQFYLTKNTTAPVPFACDQNSLLETLDSTCYSIIDAPLQTYQGVKIYTQEDAAELLRAFLNDLIASSSVDNTLETHLEALLTFKLAAELKCPALPDVEEYVRRSSEEEIMLSVEIEDELTRRPLRSLTGCLDNYFKQETLTGDNKFFHGEIGIERDNCTKQAKLQTTSEILLISLNRFKHEFPAGRVSTSKIDHSVTIPTTLDLTQYTMSQEGDHNFDLIGVVIQSGSLRAGHYWAYVKNGDQWYKCDDRSITKVSIVDPAIINEINGSPGAATGYILCYQKKRASLTKPARPSGTAEDIARQKAEEERKAIEEQRRAIERAVAETLRKQQEAQRARQQAIADELKKQQAAEEQRKATEHKKLSNQLSVLLDQLKTLEGSLSKIG